MIERFLNISKKKNVKGILIFVLYLFVLCILIRYLTRNTDILQRLKKAPPELVILGLLTSLMSIGLTGLLDVTCAKVYGMKLPLGDAIVFTFIASAINLVIPLQMGSVVKAIYYKKKMQLAYSEFLSITAGAIIVNLIITFFMLIISLFVITIGWGIDVPYLIVLSMIFFFGLATLFALLRMQDKILSILPFKTYTYPIIASFFELLGSKRAVVLCSINYFFCMVLGGIRFTTIFQCLGVSTGVIVGILYYGLYTASSIIPILPGNIGISEGVIGIMNMIIGKDFNTGVAVVMINRIYYYIVAIIGALLLAIPAWIMFRKADATT